MKTPQNSPSAIQKARAVLGKPDTVILVGSGVSVWSGLPTWTKLISDLADYVEQLGYNGQTVRDALNQGDLTLAASYGAFQLTPLQFGQFVRSACCTETAKHSALHSMIACLGPDCFITTNYDKLLEDALLERRDCQRPRIITNNQVIELPEIVRSTSRNFVFKYHGDVDNAETIVLTREQYAAFHGIYTHVSKALESLLATRPVFMIGFGLRDPDFIAVKDNLSTTFKGSFGEHYAIVPDLDSTAVDYWRKVHSVEMLTYSTMRAADGKSDHSALLDLLQELTPSKTSPVVTTITLSEEKLLRLSRFAAKLEKLRPTETALPLMVREKSRNEDRWPSRPMLAMEKLQQGLDLILLGPPGAGKSFMLKHFTADHAKVLLQACLEEGRKPELEELSVPFFANLALYQGTIEQMLQNELPTGLTIPDLLVRYQTVIVLDAANEMPEQYIEDNTFVRDLANFRKSFPDCRIIVSGRSGGWVEAIDLPKFELEEIDRDFVREHFTGKNFVNLQERGDLESTLQIPLFFNLASALTIDLDDVSTPADIHNLLVNNLAGKWIQLNHIPISFEDMFAEIAFQMLNDGIEHFQSKGIEQYLERTRSTFSLAQITNFLVAENFVHVFPERKLAFFHQSATEYLASVDLKKRFLANPKSIQERLRYRRWDHALFLTLSRLPNDEAILFFRTILEADIFAALRAYEHAKQGREEMATRILNKLNSEDFSESYADEIAISYQLEKIQWTPLLHLKQLISVSDKNSLLGGAAASAVIRSSPESRDIFIRRLLDRNYDYNYISRITSALAPGLSVSEFEDILSRVSEADDDLDTDIFSPISAICDSISADLIFEIMDRERETANGTVLKFFAEVLEAIGKKECIPRFFDLAKRGASEWAASLHFLVDSFTEKAGGIEPDLVVLELLIASVRMKEPDSQWASALLLDFYNSGSQWRTAIIGLARTMPEPLQIALSLRSSVQLERRHAEDQLKLSVDSWSDEEIRAFSEWAAEALFSLVVTKRRTVLLKSFLMNRSFRGSHSGNYSELFKERPATWWFDWTLELLSGDPESRILAMNLTSNFREDADFAQAVAAEINRRSSTTFRPLLYFLVPNLRISTDQLDDAVLTELTGKRLGLKSIMGEPIIGLMASEDFAQSVLTPMWQRAKPNSERRRLLRLALNAAGKIHNRRYVT